MSLRFLDCPSQVERGRTGGWTAKPPRARAGCCWAWGESRGWAKPSAPGSQRECWGQGCRAASHCWSTAALLSLGGCALSTMRRFLRSGHDPARERLKRDLFQFNKVRGSPVLSALHGLGHSGGLHLDGGTSWVLPAVPHGHLTLEMGSGWWAFLGKGSGIPRLRDSLSRVSLAV